MPSNPSKTTAEQKIEIRKRFVAGEDQRDIARDFGISQSTVSSIVTKEPRAHRP